MCRIRYVAIIDSGSCTNIASINLVDMLNLQITKHHVPY
jgi:hypothetical protein